MDKITFDFEKGTIEVSNDRRSTTLELPNLSERRISILRAAGLVQFDAEQMAGIIKSILNKGNDD